MAPFNADTRAKLVECSAKSSKLNRIDGARKFAKDLQTLNFDSVEFQPLRRVGYVFTPETYNQTKTLVKMLRETTPVEKP